MGESALLLQQCVSSVTCSVNQSLGARGQPRKHRLVTEFRVTGCSALAFPVVPTHGLLFITVIDAPGARLEILSVS
jgi:hypothetical protein